MTDLLKEAIADAKAVRATALANAKLALEEAFTPRIQSMLASKLAEEMEEEEMEAEPVSEEEDMEGSEEVTNEGEEETADDASMSEEDMAELEEILRELEGGEEEPMEEEYMDSSEIGNDIDLYEEDDMEDEMTEEEDMEDEMTEGEDEEEIDLEEVIRALREEDGEEEMTEEEDMEEEPVAEGRRLKEAYNVIRFLRKQINEVNLLNAKLLFSNKLFRNYELSESQKLRVIENFDRATSMREVKLVYTTICESMTRTRKKAAKMNESVASAPTRSTKPAAKVLNEGSDLAARWKKLAGLK
jgi:hypothetical protein